MNRDTLNDLVRQSKDYFVVCYRRKKLVMSNQMSKYSEDSEFVKKVMLLFTAVTDTSHIYLILNCEIQPSNVFKCIKVRVWVW